MEQEERNNQPQSDGNNGSIQSEALSRSGPNGAGDAPDSGAPCGPRSVTLPSVRRRIPTSGRKRHEAEALAAPLHTFLDERNDVMSVINELEEQLDRHQDGARTPGTRPQGSQRARQGAAQHTRSWSGRSLPSNAGRSEPSSCQEVAAAGRGLATANAQLQAANEEQARSEKERARLRNELKRPTSNSRSFGLCGRATGCARRSIADLAN